MKPIRCILAAGLALALLSTPARAITYPVFADTAGSPVTNTIPKSAGLATTLPVSARSTAYIGFGITSPGNVPPTAASVSAARLVLFFPRVIKAGNLTVFRAGSAFTETFATRTAPLPTAGPNIAVDPTFGVDAALARNFLIIDVTAEVKSWLTNLGTEQGFGIKSDGTASVLIGSKEGSGTGYPAVLEVDVNAGGATVAGTTGTFTSNLTTLGNLTSNRGYFGTTTGSFISSFVGALEVKGGNAGNSGNLRITGGGVSAALDLTPFDPGTFEGIPAARLQATDAGDFSAHLDFLTKTPGGVTQPLVNRMRLTSSGDVGIGTTTPSEKLEVKGNVEVSNDSGNASLRITAGATNGWSLRTNSSTNLPAGAFQLSRTGGATAVTVLSTGNVGIGTNSPTNARLEVRGSANTAASQFGNVRYFDLNLDGGTGPWGGGPVSIFAETNIVAGGIGLTSDLRIKSVDGLSDSAKDLETLRAIEVTDYRFKDAIGRGSGAHKKVIAQQVEKVFAQAVSQGIDVIPDIYSRAEIKDGWVHQASDLQVGERVKLIGKAGEGIYEVLEVRAGAFRTAFQSADGMVFVYGREVKDFRRVDYDAIAMLNVSATQELARKLEAKDTEIAALKAELRSAKSAHAALAAQMAAFDEKLTALKTSLEERPARTVRAALELE